ncbi:MAG: NAD(P)-dependent oxidoreductase [Gemmatimonadota bacterium]|nr:NAD(P)-dependent oxidoreductase [Gemmatimonadota bacterium]
MKRSVLIVGGAGYIGPVLAERLLACDYKVTVLDLLLYQNSGCVVPFLGNSNYRFVCGDMGNREDLDKALIGVTDVVILAGLVGDPITKKYPREAQAINFAGVQGCIDQLGGRGLKSVVLVSTCSNYGLIPTDDLADESYPLTPLSSYAKAKVAAEEHLLAKRGKVDYSPTILRFATAFGVAPRTRFDLTVNEFTRELAMGRELLVFDAHTWRPYCHVRDFARLIQTVLEAPAASVQFEVFNAGGEENNLRKVDIVETIQRLIPSGSVKYQEHGSDPRNYRVSFKKVRDVLGFAPEFTVRDGVEELISAINEKLFTRVDDSRNFFGNYEIDYDAGMP